MNIQEAKDFIRDAVSAYLDKDAGGTYVIPRIRQRPLVLMGAPGLGKTAIVSQVAAELGIGYAGYAMTHHTRQSAIGLPIVDTATFDGNEAAVTRYTMSEIISSVYDEMERHGKKEGILFIDEINCVSETLSAAMLDLLQNKKFGPHRIPDGWILVAAGNPPEFNSSAREFDIATLDRIRMMDVEPDTEVWLRYAMSSGVHDAIVYYIQLKPGNLLKIENTPEGPIFATPRGWEDLSYMMKEMDRKGLSVSVGLVSQYIANPEIAAEFKRYLDFHRKYREENNVDAILDGTVEGTKSLARAGAEEKLAVISVIIGILNSEAEAGLDLREMKSICGTMDPDNPVGSLAEARKVLSARLSDNPTSEVIRSSAFCLSLLQNTEATHDAIIEFMDTVREKDANAETKFDARLRNAVEYMRSIFGSGQETVSLLSGLLGCYSVVMYSNPKGSLYGYNDEMLSSGLDRSIREALEELE